MTELFAMRPTFARALTLLSFVAVAAIACDGPLGIAPIDSLVTGDEAYITGPVTWRDATELLIESPESEGGARAIVRVRGNTVIRFSDATEAKNADIEVGAVVSVWTTGFELRSAPPQVEARMIVVTR